MNKYALTEALQQLDAQYAHWVANLKIYGSANGVYIERRWAGA